MSEDVTLEQYTDLKNQFDDLKGKFDILLEKSEQFKTEIEKRDEKIKNLNDRLYDMTFTTKKTDDPGKDDEPKDFKTLYFETLDSMRKEFNKR